MKNPQRRSRLLHAARFRGRGFAGAGAVSRRRLVTKEERTSEARVRRGRAACTAASGDWDGWMHARGATWITSQRSAPRVPRNPVWRSRPTCGGCGSGSDPVHVSHSSDDIVPTGDERRATNSGRSNPSAALCSGSVFLAPPVEICISGPPLLTPLLHAPPRLRARWLPCQMGRVFWSATSKTVSFSAFFIFPQLTPPAAVCRFQTCFCHVPRWQAMTALEFRWPELACFTFSPICKAI